MRDTYKASDEETLKFNRKPRAGCEIDTLRAPEQETLLHYRGRAKAVTLEQNILAKPDYISRKTQEQSLCETEQDALSGLNLHTWQQVRLSPRERVQPVKMRSIRLFCLCVWHVRGRWGQRMRTMPRRATEALRMGEPTRGRRKEQVTGDGRGWRSLRVEEGTQTAPEDPFNAIALARALQKTIIVSWNQSAGH